MVIYGNFIVQIIIILLFNSPWCLHIRQTYIKDTLFNAILKVHLLIIKAYCYGQWFRLWEAEEKCVAATEFHVSSLLFSIMLLPITVLTG
jgi:hypothetical protein